MRFGTLAAQWDELITVVGVQQSGPAAPNSNRVIVKNPHVERCRSSLPVQRELQSDGCSGHDLFTSNHLSMQLKKDTASQKFC